VTREATTVSQGNEAAVDAAQPTIEALSARAAGENFPVALRVLPVRYRRHLMAVYRFARFVDDIGDEGPAHHANRAEHRLRALDAVETDLDAAFSQFAPAGAEPAEPVKAAKAAKAAAEHAKAAEPVKAAEHAKAAEPVKAAEHAKAAQPAGAPPGIPVVRDAARTAAECAIPAQPFRMLIQANRQDQAVGRYGTFAELSQYCELSANPVGRIVLHIFGAATPERERLSDLVCTALQLAEHWQDVAEDFAAGRIYLPREDMAAFGCVESDLAVPAGRTGTPPCVRRLMRFETERAGRLLDEGAALTGTLRGWARLAVAGYVAGGRAALAAIAAAGYDVLSVTPRPRRVKVATELLRAYVTGR
jgi:squalene synthase HpnC